MKLFHIYGGGLEPTHADRHWLERSKADWLCPLCRTPKIDGPIDVVLMDEPARTALTVVFGAGVGIARADFLEAFGKGVAEQHLHLGRVFGSIGAETPNYVSFRGKQSALIRGNEKSTHRHCEECNAVLYHPMGDRYLLARPEGFGDLMESQLNQLIVSEPLLERVRASGRFEFAVDELPILDEPRDGLSKDPAEWPPPPMTESRERYERIMASHRRAKARLDAERGS